MDMRLRKLALQPGQAHSWKSYLHAKSRLGCADGV